MNYQESVDFVENAIRYGGSKCELKNITELLKRLGNPHHDFPAVHVAGTNGKGSTCAMIERAIRKSGLKVGLFTSPYLQQFTERIRINGEEISKDIFAKTATRVRNLVEEMVEEGHYHPTFFEMVTAIAFIIYKEEKVDIAVIETGLGGLLDATNVLDPVVTVITSIGMDHENVLGGTIEAIAQRKAGIIKPGCPVVIYPQPYDAAYAELLGRAHEVKAPVYSVRDARIIVQSSGLDGHQFKVQFQEMEAYLSISLMGAHQVLNATTAFITLCVLAQQGFKVRYTDMVMGLKEAKWPGRLEVISKDPLILLDGAHNPQAALQLRRSLDEFLPGNKVVLLIGSFKTKDSKGIRDVLYPIAQQVIVTRPNSDRATEPMEIATLYNDKGVQAEVYEDVSEALDAAYALAKVSGAPLMVTGSLYLVGEARSLLLKGMS